MAHNDVVSVTIVTYNSGRFIKRCLESVLAQRYPFKEIIIVDNASSDGTIDILEQFEDRCQVYYNEENVGFAAAQNQAIQVSGGDWVLTLNPDVLLLPNFIQALVDAGQFDSKIGTVCGKLLTMTSHFEIPEKPVVDSTGIYFNPMLRHLDRGSQEVDNGHYLQYEYVFGATAAAALYRRSMIDDIALDGEFFDSDFFVYREDADVAWRAQLMGWKCLYAPEAVVHHHYSHTAGRATPLKAYYVERNRLFLLVKNFPAGSLIAAPFVTLIRYGWHVLSLLRGRGVAARFRDDGKGGGLRLAALVIRAHWSFLRNWNVVWDKRRAIARTARISPAAFAELLRAHAISPREVAEL
jgi:GT2 family glycosyltransferase